VGSRSYVLGGYDGVSPTKPVLATRNGTRFATVADLAVPVRYPAVAATPQSIVIFGGETAAGTPTDAIQELDLATGRTRVVGRLPAALDHASAATLAGGVYLLGGDVDGSPTDRIWRFNPRSGAIRGAGRLPHPVADAAAATIGDTAYLAGGVTAGTEPLDTVVSVAAASVPRN
jgi:N-acetylneuraminic acid mutarotase